MENDFEYTVRTSAKAKNAHIRVSPRAGVEVVIPDGSRINIEKLIDSHSMWITKQIKKYPKQIETQYPHELPLKLLGRTIKIEYQESEDKFKLKQKDDTSIVISGYLDSLLVKQHLSKWIAKKARQVLTPMLEEISLEINLPYNKLSIRGQSTLWGSCTHDKNISLNYKLLFVPYCLARYVLIHELCHTKHLNHSCRFWGLVGKYDDDYLLHKKWLKDRGSFIPSWLNLK